MVGQFGCLECHSHNGYMLSMYSAQVGIFQEACQVVLSDLLQHLYCAHLEAQVMLPISLCYLADHACEGLLTNEELSTLLVLVYLVENHYSWLVPLVLL